MTLLFAASLALPLVLALLLSFAGRMRLLALAVAPWAPLPALVLALVAPAGTSVQASWLVLGTSLGVDSTGRTFLLLTSILWLLAGIYAVPYLRGHSAMGRYFGFHLLCYAGNLGLVLSHDIAGFYLGFLVMTLAAFGLIIFEGTDEARRASLVYLVLAMLGEGLMLAGLVQAARSVSGLQLPALAGADLGLQASALLVLGFGVKAGLPLLHVWLPLAHPQAPTPASAVLSGAMIKAGLLGWLRFLPLGESSLPSLGAVLLSAGLFAAFFAAAWGVFQERPKAILAYSSVSQMGFMTVPVGAALILPETWSQGAAAVALFAFHHAMTKGALFLGAGVAERVGGSERSRSNGEEEGAGAAGAQGPATAGARRTVVVAGLIVAAAALVGLPFTSGAVAKSVLEEALYETTGHSPLLSSVPLLLKLATAGTGLLMLRFLATALPRRREGNGAAGAGMLLSWTASLLAVLIAPLALARSLGLPVLDLAGAMPSHAWELAWPALLAAAIFVLFLRGRVPGLPPGDVLVPLERLALLVVARASALASMLTERLEESAQRNGTPRPERWTWLERLESDLMRWDSGGTLLLALAALMTLALWRALGG